MMMSSLKLVFIFCVGLGIGLVLYHLNAKNNTNLSDDYWPPQHNTIVNDTVSVIYGPPKFDYFVFVLQWPAAFCNIQRSRPIPPPPAPPPRKCNPDQPFLPQHRNKFTVHGLWPQLNGAESPLFCRPVPQQMTYNDLVAVQNDLLDLWPDLFDARRISRSPRSFWMREWDKHGTCSSLRFGPQQYLAITIDLARRFAQPIYNQLLLQGINPDGITPHREADIRAAVRQVTNNHEPIINMQLNHLGEHLLLEIHLCVENDGRTLRNCDPVYRFAAP